MGHRLPSVLQLLSNSLSLVSFISLATVLLCPGDMPGESLSSLSAVEGLCGGDSLESERCGRPRRARRRPRSRVSGAGRGSGSGASTLKDSPKESRDPLIGVGTILIKFAGTWFPFWFLGEIGRLPTDWSSSESTSAIRKSADVL